MYNEQKKEASKSIKDKKKSTKIITIIIAILIALLAIFFIGYSSATTKSEKTIQELNNTIDELREIIDQMIKDKKNKIDITVIKTEITAIAELATIEYSYTDSGKFESPKQLFGKDIPFTTKSFIAKWDGTIKAGIDTDKIEINLNKKTNEIIVSMPKAEILSHEIHEDSIETLDEQDGLFNPIKVDDVRNFDATCKKAMEIRATENGILDRAFENAKVIIEKLINNEILKEQGYTLKFEEIEQ